MTAAAVALPQVRRMDRRVVAAVVVVVWVVLYQVLGGRDTLALGPSGVTGFHTKLNQLNSAIGQDRNSNPFFVYFINEIYVGVNHLVLFFQGLLSQPAYGRPVPLIGWLGVVVLAAYLSWVFGNAKVAVLTAAGFVFIGLQGLWQDSMDTLALTLSAVLIALVIGIPLGVWAGVSNIVSRIVTPVLDVMQIMPTFVYLAPLVLLFLIGPASATIATLIYALPPVIRITAHGVRSVSVTTLEAAESMGSTRWQRLRKVMLPMAKRTIVLGVNQTIMAALSMAVMAALIGAPGLGQTVVNALETLDVGMAFNAGLAIVILAIVLDRATTAASVRAENARRAAPGLARKLRRPALGIGAVVTVIALYLAYTYQYASRFPTALTFGSTSMSTDIGSPIQRWVTLVSNAIQQHFSGVTNAIKNAVTNGAINPLQALLEGSPWYLAFAAIVLLALLAGGLRAAIVSAACLGLIIGTGLWQDSMVTLAAVLVATIVVVILAVIFGVWMGRSGRADRFIRPVLDAGQTMPSFVYLVPFIALFAASRFTGIIAAVVYATPVATKIVADGVSGVSQTAIEAATSVGSSRWQVIRKVQLPMSTRSLALAANQGLIYVLAMVVIGGLVGSGALGYDIVNGFSQAAYFGKGLAAGLAIVLLGILLDRTSQAATRRASGGLPAGHGR
ncbi:MAG: ABC transporter permease [Sciscionella sp.]